MEKFLATNSVLSIAARVPGTGDMIHGHLSTLFPVQRYSTQKRKDGKRGVWYVMANAREFGEYRQKVQLHQQRLQQRLQYLTSGPERVMGQVLQQRVVFVLDISGSMFPTLPQLQAAMKELLQTVVLQR